MRQIAVLCVLTLAACDGSGNIPAEPAGSQSARISSQAPADPAAAQPAPLPSAAVSADTGEVDCKGMPAFAALTKDAVIDGCFISQAGPGFGNGTVIFATMLGADAVIAFYRSKARASGLADGPAASGAYAANDGRKRTIKVTTSPGENGGLRVTLNWTQD